MRVFLLTILLLPLFFLPALVSAEHGTNGIVPCHGTDCQTCHFIQLGNNIISWLVGVMSIVCGLIIAFAGFKMVMSAGNSGAITQAKDMMTNTIVGFVILLSAWLIVDTVMKTFVNQGVLVGPWNEIQCVDQPRPTATTPGGVISAPPTTGTGGSEVWASGGTAAPSGTCATCVQIPTSVCKNASSCTISENYYKALSQISAPITITEAYPPTRAHQNVCHSVGTCTDVVFTDRQWTTERITAFQAEAAAAGMRAVFEPGTDFNGGLCTGIPNCTPQSKTRATGTHFSLYQQ